MNIKGLVSIITPCYNGESFVGRFLDSVLSQTYDNIELIIINDGSTDDTESVILSYKNKFIGRGFNFKYIYQENAGQSAAINKGLEIFKGEYLTWPDSDDILTPDAIELKVSFLNLHHECGTVICRTEIVDNKTLSHLGTQQRIKPESNDNIFIDLITGTNVYYSPGGYMVRSSMFIEAMPKPLFIECPREIGQNYQMLLPITFYYPTGYIDNVCYKYSVRRDSHSRTSHSFEKDIEIIQISQRVLSNIVYNLKMNDSNQSVVKKALAIQRVRNLLRVMIKHHRNDLLVEVYNDIKQFNINEQDIKMAYYRIKYPLLNLILRIYSYAKRNLLSMWYLSADIVN